MRFCHNGESPNRQSTQAETLETPQRNISLLRYFVLWAVFQGITSANSHHPVNMTWMVYDPETGKILNSSSNVAPKGTWWPVLTFDLCVLMADSAGYGHPPHLDLRNPTTDRRGSYGVFTHNCEGKGSQYLEQVPVYVCPGGGRGWNQIEKCGGVDSFYCAAWGGCETSGMVPWPINPGNDLLQVKLPQNTPKCRSQDTVSKPGQCFPLQIKLTDKGKKFTRWDVGRAWDLHLYKTGFDNGVRFELNLKMGPLYLTPKVALGPNQVIAPKPSSQVVTPKPPSQNQSQDTGPTPHTPPIADMSSCTDPL